MRTISLLVALLFLLPACGDDAPPTPVGPPMEAPAAIVFQKGEQPVGGFAIASGQPEEARFRALAPLVHQVVSLRMPSENPFDEAAVAKEVGASFVQIGIDKQRMRDEAVRAQVYDLLDAGSKADNLTWIHCGSSDRVGALYALWRAERESKPLEEAIEDGKRAGLKTLEPLVREILADKPAK